MTIFHPLVARAALHDGYKTAFDVGGVSILLIQQNGIVYAVENKCGHFGIPLITGTVMETSIRCSQHGAMFDLATGKVLNRVVSQCDPLRVFEIRIEDGNVGVTA